MRGSVQSFLTELNDKKHISQLIQNEERFSIYFVMDDQNFSLCICNGNAEITDQSDSLQHDCVIQGRNDAVNRLLCGEARLRELIRTGDLKIKAPFRNILKAESIFHLARTQNKGIQMS